MARGRPRTSPEAKAAKKERAAADKAEALAMNALAKLPAEKERRDELWAELRQCKVASRAAAGDTSAQKKRMREVFGILPSTEKIVELLMSLKTGVYEATLQQVEIFMKDQNRPWQLNLNLEPGKGVADDQGSVFDSSKSGETVAAERGDDPGRAGKRRGPPPPPPVTTPNVGVEGLAAGIKPLESPEEKRARIEAEKQADAAAFDAGDATDKADALDAEMKNMTPAQKRAHAKKIADEVFAKGRASDDGVDAPGTYRVQ